MDDGHLADHLAARRAGRAQREADFVARQIPCEQQIALGVVAVEHLLPGQPVQIGGDQPFGAARLAAHPDPDELRHQHGEAYAPVGDPLFGHLDGGDIAGLAQHGRGAVPDLAKDSDIVLPPGIGRPGRAQLLGRQPAQLVEGDVLEGQADVLIFGPVERAGRAFDAALDAQPRARLFDGGRRRTVDLLAGWRRGLGRGGRHADGLDAAGHGNGERDAQSPRRGPLLWSGRRTLTHNLQAPLTAWPSPDHKQKGSVSPPAN